MSSVLTLAPLMLFKPVSFPARLICKSHFDKRFHWWGINIDVLLTMWNRWRNVYPFTVVALAISSCSFICLLFSHMVSIWWSTPACSLCRELLTALSMQSAVVCSDFIRPRGLRDKTTLESVKYLARCNGFSFAHARICILRSRSC